MKKTAYIHPRTTQFQASLTAMIAGSLTGTTGAAEENLPPISSGIDDGSTDAGARDNKFFDTYFW